MTKTSKIPQLCIALAATGWGLTGLFTRELSAAGFSYFDIAGVRVFLSGVLVFAFLLLTDRKSLKFKLKDIWIFLLMGFFGSAMLTTLYFYTMELITLSAASILLYTAPFMIIIVSAILFKEKFTRSKTSALFIAFAGCVMTVGIVDRDELSTFGIILGLVCALLYTINTTVAKFGLRKYSPFTIAVYCYFAASLILLPFCDVAGIVTLIRENTENVTNFLLLVVFISALPAILYYKGLEKTQPGRASIITFIEPMVATAAGLIVYNEMLTVVKVFGICLIFLSLFILSLQEQ